MNGPDWDAVAARYASGETLEELALDLWMTPGTVRSHIADLVPMRPRGQRPGSAHRRNARNENTKRVTHLDPAARIVRPSVARWYR